MAVGAREIRRSDAMHALRPDQRYTGISLPARRRILRRADGAGRHLLDVLLLVRRVPLPHGGPAQGSVLLQEGPGTQLARGTIRSKDRPARATKSGQGRSRVAPRVPRRSVEAQG